MGRFIKSTLLLVVITSTVLCSDAISGFFIKNYNNIIECLCSHSVNTSNPLGF